MGFADSSPRKEMQRQTSETWREGDLVEVAVEKMLSGTTKDQQKSLPLACPCLLCRANEKNRMVEGAEGLSDVLGKQGG